jgi:serine phosphatase RsbU (regulator of sigma subunit)/pSer/pThr/pTyr-binding forkhead associated (FHA) protein
MALELIANVDGRRRSWKLTEDTCIGRRGDLPVCLPDRSVSRVHAVLHKQDNAISIEDLSSFNGTFVNGMRLYGSRLLRPGDKIAIGKFFLRLEDSKSSLPDPTTAASGSGWTLDGRTPPLQSEGPSHLYRTLMHLGEFLVGAHTEQEIDFETLHVLEKILPYRRACMLRLDPAGNPSIVAMRCTDQDLDASTEICWEGVQEAMRSARPVFIGRNDPDPRATPFTAPQPAHSVAVIPLCTEDELVGALYLEAPDPARGYTTKHVRRLGFLANLLAMKASNARLAVVRDEVRTAACVQQALLCKEPLCPPEYEVCARLVPSTAMSGDLYETLVMPEGRYLYALGDVVGHGLGAALLMANVLAAIRALALAESEPLALVQRLHEQMRACVGENSYVTMFLAILDPRLHRVSYVNAGHQPPALVEGTGSVQRLEPTGPALGMRIDEPFTSGAVEMRPGSLLCVWSDGLTEADREHQGPPDFFGDDRLLEVVTSRPAPLDSIVQSVFMEVDRWLAGSRAEDDRTMLLLRRRAEPQP